MHNAAPSEGLGSSVRDAGFNASVRDRQSRERGGGLSRGLACALCLVAGTGFLCAQGTFTPLQTGSGQPLVSDQVPVPLPGVIAPVVLFDFGFATDETPAPGVFLDSFTVTLEDPSSGATIVVATVDASGVVWAPLTPGAIGIPDADILRGPIAPPAASPVLGRGTGYTVRVPLPSQFAGATCNVDFDLFDNLDPRMSVGWYSGVRLLAVPEPRVVAIIALGFWAIARIRNRQK